MAHAVIRTGGKQFLIEQGADVNKPLPDTGESPLHAALCTPIDRPMTL